MIQSPALDRIIEDGRYRYVINGHMHFRTMIHFDAMTLINAGTLKGEQWPGFMLIDFATEHITSFKFGSPEAKSQIEIARHMSILPEPEQVTWRDTQAFSGDWQPLTLH